MNKKLISCFLLTSIFSLGLSSCGDKPSQDNSSGDATYVNDERYNIYKLYISSGGDMTYEEWLRSIQGANGSSLLNGTSNPSTELGNNGDTYINVSTWDVFVKNGGSWSKVGNIMGQQGEPGKDGSSVLTGSGEPASSLGNNGDSYIDLQTWNYYVKKNGKWVLSGNLSNKEIYQESYKNILSSKNYTVEYTVGGTDTYKEMYADEGFLTLSGVYGWYFGERYEVVNTDDNNEPIININQWTSLNLKEQFLAENTFGEYVKYTTFIELSGYSNKFVATRPYANGQDAIFQKIINTFYDAESIEQLSAMKYASIVFDYTNDDELIFYLVEDYRDLTKTNVYLQGRIFDVGTTTLGFTPKLVYSAPSEE